WPLVREHGHGRHRFHAASNHDIGGAGGYPAHGVVDGVDARGAEPIEGDPGDRVGESGHQGGGFGEVPALESGLAGDPQDHVVDLLGVDPAAGGDFNQDRPRHFEGGDTRQAPAGRRLSARGTHPVAQVYGWDHRVTTKLATVVVLPPTLRVWAVRAPGIWVSSARPVTCREASNSIRTPVAPTG